MPVIMTKRKADAIRSVEHDRYLISDVTARDRVLEAEPERDRAPLKRVAESKQYLEARMKAGR